MTMLPGADLPRRMAALLRTRGKILRRRQSTTPRNLNMPPGTIVVAPEELPPRIVLIRFGPEHAEEREIASVADIPPDSPEFSVTWLNVEGLGDAAVLKAIADRYAIHPLIMEDVADTTQRAKVEPYDDTTFVVLPMPHSDEKGFWTEQLSMILAPKLVITFQSAHSGDCLDELRARIRAGKGRVRFSGGAYLSYAIADAVIDAYFPILARIGDSLESIEESVFRTPSGRQLVEVRRMRSDIVRIRRAVYPMRDAMSAFSALDRVFDRDTRPYLRDLNDHVSRLLDQLDTDRYLANDLLEMSMTSINLRIGETSKVLTIIATIFIPLSFIASVYGMNFHEMPELSWPYGYYFALGLMALTALAFLWYFWRKGWLRDQTK
ncbi:MAG: magnesium/cobalt transporter CorA [Phycisphaerales bacterium]